MFDLFTCFILVSSLASFSSFVPVSLQLKDDAGPFVAVAGGAGRVFAACARGTLVMLDAAAGSRLRRVQQPGAAFTRCCYAPPGAGGFPPCAVVGTADGTVLCFALPAADPCRRFPYDPALRDPACRTAAAAAAGVMGKAGAGGADSETRGMACGTDGLAAAAAGGAVGAVCARLTEDKTLAVLDTAGGRVLALATGHMGPVTGVTWLKAGGGGGMRVVSGGRDETVGVWDGVQAASERDSDLSGGRDRPGCAWRACGRLGLVDAVRVRVCVRVCVRLRVRAGRALIEGCARLGGISGEDSARGPRLVRAWGWEQRGAGPGGWVQGGAGLYGPAKRQGERRRL